MSPENQAIRNLDRRTRPEEIKEVAATLLKNAEKVRERLDEIAFDPQKFEDLYTEAGVENDLRYVENMNRLFDQTSRHEVIEGLTERDVKELSERVEYEVIRGINVGQWFEGVGAYKTSEFDDIANGVDVVLEIQEGKNFGQLGLGVDITFSHNVEKKFKRIKDEIDNYDGDKNRLARVKYFDSPNTGTRGELNNLVRAVIAVDLPMLKDMTGTKDPQSLHTHISRHITLLEIQHQLDVFLRYAEQKNPAATKPIQRAADFIHDLVERLDSEVRLQQSEYTKNRRADDALVKGLGMFAINDGDE
ncbi:MAG: hypothetical protein RL538_87 [Candidatus Parcubacteria bacterium]|jgi:hypothetical protein